MHVTSSPNVTLKDVGHSWRMQRSWIQLTAVPSVYAYTGGRYRKTRGSVITLISNIYTSFTTGPWPTVTRGPSTHNQLRFSDTLCTCSFRRYILKYIWRYLPAIARFDQSRASGIADPKNPISTTLPENARSRKVKVVLTVFSMSILGHRLAVVVVPSLHLAITWDHSCLSFVAFWLLLW